MPYEGHPTPVTDWLNCISPMLKRLCVPKLNRCAGNGKTLIRENCLYDKTAISAFTRKPQLLLNKWHSRPSAINYELSSGP